MFDNETSAWFDTTREYDDLSPDEWGAFTSDYFFERGNLNALYAEINGEDYTVPGSILSEDPAMWGDDLSSWISSNVETEDGTYSGTVWGGEYNNG